MSGHQAGEGAMSGDLEPLVLGVCSLCGEEVRTDGDQRMIVATGRYVHGKCLLERLGYDCLDTSSTHRWLDDPIITIMALWELLQQVKPCGWTFGAPDDVDECPGRTEGRRQAASIPPGWAEARAEFAPKRDLEKIQ